MSVSTGNDVPNRGGFIGWFVRNPVAANLVMVILLVGGALTATNMRAEVFPVLEPGLVTVSVPFPGATPAEVEEGITRRVEEAVLGIDGVKRVSSTASENNGVVSVEVDDFADTQLVKDDVQAAVDRIVDFPPDNAEEPNVVAAKTTGGVVTLALIGDVSPRVLRGIAEDIERDLIAEPGISLVSITGVQGYEISIEVSEDTLRNFDLTFEEVATAVRRASIDLAGGSLETSSGEILVRVNQKRQTGDAFNDIVVRADETGAVLRLSDVAIVRDGLARGNLINTYDGRPAIFIDISRAEAEDVLSVKDAVDAYLANFTPPAGIELVEFRDQTILLRDRVNLLLRNGIFGFALVFLFLVLMLDLKLATWVTIGIATAFLGGFTIFGALGVTITMVSLFGLIIVLGLVVDDAIVIGENIDAARASGLHDDQAAIAGVRGVFGPVLVGVMTSVAAFFPLTILGGTFGDIVRAIPVVVIATLAVSLLEAFVILPSHLSHGGNWSRGPVRVVQESVARGMIWVGREVIGKGVAFAARWRYATAGAAAAIVIFAFQLVGGGMVKFIFFPSIEPDSISATVTMPEGTPFERTRQAVAQIVDGANRVAADIEAEVGQTPFANVVATTGGQALAGGGPGDAGGFEAVDNVGSVTIELTGAGGKAYAATELERRWRAAVGPIPGTERLIFTSTFASFGADIEYELAHGDESQLIAAAERLKDELASVAGVNQIEDSFDIGKRQLVFTLTPAGEAAGLQPADIATQIRQAFFGEEVQRVQRGREEIRVFVRYPNEARFNISTLDDFRVRLPDGSGAPLSTVAVATESRAFSSIDRIDGRRVVTVSANADDEVTTPSIANSTIMEDILPGIEEEFPSLRWTLAGAAREQNEDFADLGRMFVIVILVIFALVASQLRSYWQPIAILASIPLGVAGAIYGHWVLGYDLSFVSIFGMIALSGVAVNASVVLIDFYNQQRASGVERIEAAAAASERRFRPVLLTTLTTALGLGPLLLETSPQAQFLIPMGVSLGFGILVSGILVLIVTPCVALIIEDVGNAMRAGVRRFSGRAQVPAE